MAEYIEREALMRRIKEIHCAECDSYHGVRCRACWVDDTLNYVDCEPAADVVEVVHAEWEEIDGGYRCTNCHHAPIVGIDNEFRLTNFCPNCGADMRG